MTIYIHANERLTTWRLIANAGRYQPYRGRAVAGDVVLRWGANGGNNVYPQGVRVLNPRLLLDKLHQHNHFLDYEVNTPRTFNTVREWLNNGSPPLLRKPRVGQMGTGIVRVRTMPDNPRGDCIYQEFINKEHEYRAMMVGGLLAFFMEKHPPENGDFRWNEHRGATWTAVPENRDLRRKVKRLGKKALEAIGYDFGAIDIIQDEDGTLYVLEINSRPEFGEPNANRFVRAIENYL